MELKASMLEQQHRDLAEKQRSTVEAAELQKRGLHTKGDPYYIPAPLPPRQPPLGLTKEAKEREDLPDLGPSAESLQAETQRILDSIKNRRAAQTFSNSNVLTKRPPQTVKAPRQPDEADISEAQQAELMQRSMEREKEARETAKKVREEIDKQKKDLFMQQVFGGF